MLTFGIAIVFITLLRALTAPLLMLPDASLPAAIDSAFSNIGQYLGVINGFIPVASFIAVFGFILGFEAIYLVFRLIKFILSRT